MIYLITGANAYQADVELRRLLQQYAGGDVERVDGASMTIESLAGVLMGATLWSSQRTVVVRGLSENKMMWDKLGEWIDRDQPDVTMILLEQSVDKRTKSYKLLAAHAKIIQLNEWTDRSIGEAREWTRQQAAAHDVRLKPRQVETIVERAMSLNPAGKWVIDQYVIHRALAALPTGEEASDDAIDAVLPVSSFTNVFDLLETAIDGEMPRLEESLERLKHSEDPYKIIGLIASQWANIVAVHYATVPPSVIAGDLGVSPYALQGAARLAGRISATKIAPLTFLLADMDMQTKNTMFDPWLALERFLYTVAAR